MLTSKSCKLSPNILNREIALNVRSDIQYETTFEVKSVNIVV